MTINLTQLTSIVDIKDCKMKPKRDGDELCNQCLKVAIPNEEFGYYKCNHCGYTWACDEDDLGYEELSDNELEELAAIKKAYSIKKNLN